MPRKKLSEFRSKKIYSSFFNYEFNSILFEADTDDIQQLTLDKKIKYVVKVDQAVKRRNRLGLIKLNRSHNEVLADITEFKKQGYTKFIIEPLIVHSKQEEQFLSITLKRHSVEILHSKKGGVDIESNKSEIVEYRASSDSDLKNIATRSGIAHIYLKSLLKLMDINHISYLEINPLIARKGVYYALDLACEVDDAALLLITNWDESDFRFPITSNIGAYEKNVINLDRKSQASFRLKVLNPNGKIFMILSGGGASVTLADEVDNLGFGNLLANYGEYSGGPSSEESSLYATQVIDLLLASNQKNKVLVIAGGVANFTDVEVTFRGIIDALNSRKKSLNQQKIKVFIRRGGPNEKQGLANIKLFLDSIDVESVIAGSDMILTNIVKLAVKGNE